MPSCYKSCGIQILSQKKKKQNTPNNKIKPAESYAEKRIQFSPMEKLSIVNLIIVFLIIAYTFVTQYET